MKGALPDFDALPNQIAGYRSLAGTCSVPKAGAPSRADRTFKFAQKNKQQSDRLRKMFTERSVPILDCCPVAYDWLWVVHPDANQQAIVNFSIARESCRSPAPAGSRYARNCWPKDHVQNSV